MRRFIRLINVVVRRLHLLFLIIDCTKNRTDHCPAALVTAIREAHSKDEIIINVSVANDGDWFLRTDEFNSEPLMLFSLF
jgi:hypothetical protein